MMLRVARRSNWRIRQGLVVALTALAMTGIAACGGSEESSSQTSGSGSGATDPVTITVGYNKFWSVPPFFVGRKLGYFDQLEGVNVKWEEFDAPTAALAALAAGDVDALATPGPNLIQSRASGVPVVGVASLAGESDPAQYTFVAKTGAGISGVADLAGATIGVNNYAGNFDLHLRYMLEEEGIDPEKDVNITVVPISSVVQSVLSGSIDAGAVVGAGSLQVEQESDLVNVFASKDVAPLRNGYAFMILGLSEDLIQNHRDAAVEFLGAYAKAVDEIEADPENAAKLWAEDSGVAIMESIRTMNEFPEGGAVPVQGLESDVELLEKYGYLTGDVDMNDLVDPTLLEDARAATS